LHTGGQGALDYSDFGTVDMVIEAAIEDVKLKQEIFADLERACRKCVGLGRLHSIRVHGRRLHCLRARLQTGVVEARAGRQVPLPRCSACRGTTEPADVARHPEAIVAIHGCLPASCRDAILSTNTSTINIDLVGAKTSCPGKHCAGQSSAGSGWQLQQDP